MKEKVWKWIKVGVWDGDMKGILIRPDQILQLLRYPTRKLAYMPIGIPARNHESLRCPNVCMPWCQYRCFHRGVFMHFHLLRFNLHSYRYPWQMLQIFTYTMHCLQMYSLYKDPSGEVNLDFSNMTTNLSGSHSKGSDVGKKVIPIIMCLKLPCNICSLWCNLYVYAGQDLEESACGFYFERNAHQWHWEAGPQGTVLVIGCPI